MKLTAPSITLMIISSLLITISVANRDPYYDDHAVLDVDGKGLIAGESYYIIPVIPKDGGALSLKEIDSDRCPVIVIQEEKNYFEGLPVKFLPSYTDDRVIRLSSDVNVVFKSKLKSKCDVWKVRDAKYGKKGRRYVVGGGQIGYPGRTTVNNWFKIERIHKKDKYYNYVIEFCPEVCSYCKVKCEKVGVVKEYGKRLVGLDAKPLVVKFKKADDLE